MNNDTKYVKYGKLLSGLIHNLNTPLMGLSGRVELLQMKFDDEKSFNQINTQLDKINHMLLATAYLLDKDNCDRDLEIDLKAFLENYFSFLYTDMRFKHQIEKELNFEPFSLSINASDLLNCLHTIVDYILNYIDDKTTLIVNNTTIENKPVINITLQLNSEINKDLNIEKCLNENLSDDTLKKFLVSSTFGENNISITMLIDRT